MLATERRQIAQILHNYVEREYIHHKSLREFYDHLIESWRKTGHAGTGTLDRDSFAELVQAAMEP